METPTPFPLHRLALAFLILLFWQSASAAETSPPRIVGVKRLTHEIQLSFTSPGAFNSRLETSSHLDDWTTAYTFSRSTSTQSFNLPTRFAQARFYRVVELDTTNAFTGDHLATLEGDLVSHPVNHASFVASWNKQVIYFDPVGVASRYRDLPRPTVVFLTDIHSDHMDSATLNALGATNAIILAPLAVFQQLSTGLRRVTQVLTNGAIAEVAGINVQVIPMYNTTAARLGYHTKGRGNGYVLTLGGRRIYVSGDTEDIPEMRALRNIDAAFVCMNLPFTMDINQAAAAVQEFAPRVVYPYHYSGSDVQKFSRLVGTSLTVEVEVRLRKWY